MKSRIQNGGHAGPSPSPGLPSVPAPSATRNRGGTAAELVRGLHYADAGMRVEDLATQLDRDPAILTVGVVDGLRRPVGLVVRRNLFDLLGKPFGRDLLRKKTVVSIAETARVFPQDTNVFALSEALREDLRRSTDRHYVTTAADGTFTGIFSARDLLLHLSAMTERDIGLARRLQSSIVKGDFGVRGEGYSVHCVSRMAKEVGGDFYAVRALENGSVLLCVCDVSGKGIAASLITSVLGGMLDSYTSARGLDAFLVGLNRYLFTTFQMEFFVTGVFLEYQPRTGRMQLRDMGHSYLLVQEGSTLLRVRTGPNGLPLGVDEPLVPEPSSFRLKPGALLFVYTDGVIEQCNAAGEEFSEKRLWTLLRANAGMDPKGVCEVLLRGLTQFRGREPQRDDLTFLAMKRE